MTLVSVPLMLEYEAVLTRPEQLEETGLTGEESKVLLDALAAVAEPVKLRFLWRPQLKDAADEMILETAVNGRADRLVTFNLRHPFNLRHLGEAAMTFGIRAKRPGDVLRELRGGKNETE